MGFLMSRDEIPKVDVLLSDEITKDLRTMKVRSLLYVFIVECGFCCERSI